MDGTFTLILRAIFAGAFDLLSCSSLKDLLSAWGRCALICNMPLERLLALYRRSTPEQSPNVEKVIAQGYAAALLQQHSGAGGRDPRVVTRDDLLVAGVPIRASERGDSDVQHLQMRRAKFLYMNTKTTAFQREHNANIEAGSGAAPLRRGELL